MAGNAQQNASFSIEMLLFANESLTTELLPYDDVIVPDFIYVVVLLEIDPSNQRFYLQVDYCINLYVTFLVLLPYSPDAFQRNKRCLWILLLVILLCVLLTRGGVEDTRLEAKAKAKDTKKIRGQGQGQGQPFRGQNLSRPRTGMLEAKAKDQGHRRKCSPKKKSSKIFFRRSPIRWRTQNLLG